MSEQLPRSVETAPNWAAVGDRCEEILGAHEGKRISQRTWQPDAQPNALQIFGISYGLTLVMARVGQVAATIDSTYELTYTGRDYKGVFRFQPYIAEPTLHHTGSEPKLVPEEAMQAAKQAMLHDYLNTYIKDADG